MQLITYYPNGSPYIVEERVSGIRIHDVLIHNGKGKEISTLGYYRGQINRITYYQNGQRHNLHGPADMSWYDRGRNYYIAYRQNNILHNLHGPAYISWYDDEQYDRIKISLQR